MYWQFQCVWIGLGNPASHLTSIIGFSQKCSEGHAGSKILLLLKSDFSHLFPIFVISYRIGPQRTVV